VYKPVVVLDTNIYVSSLFWHGNPYQIVQEALNNEILVFISDKIIEELKRVLKRDFGLLQSQINEAIDAVTMFTNLIKPEEEINILTEDQTDNRILECAAASKAEFIITGDNHLLKLKRFRNTRILKPEQFLKLA
jgi:putative PIN family toxin of toxin-antitoxin system